MRMGLPDLCILLCLLYKFKQGSMWGLPDLWILLCLICGFCSACSTNSNRGLNHYSVNVWPQYSLEAAV
jgi:hypothetical protein